MTMKAGEHFQVFSLFLEPNLSKENLQEGSGWFSWNTQYSCRRNQMFSRSLKQSFPGCRL